MGIQAVGGRESCRMGNVAHSIIMTRPATTTHAPKKKGSGGPTTQNAKEKKKELNSKGLIQRKAYIPV